MIKSTNIRLQVTVNEENYKLIKKYLEIYKFSNDSQIVNFALADYLQKVIKSEK